MAQYHHLQLLLVALLSLSCALCSLCNVVDGLGRSKSVIVAIEAQSTLIVQYMHPQLACFIPILNGRVTASMSLLLHCIIPNCVYHTKPGILWIEMADDLHFTQYLAFPAQPY